MMTLKDENRIIGIMAMVIAIVGLIVPYILPDHVLADSASLRAFSNFMSRIVPAIDNLSRTSDFSQITRLYLSIMWATVPLQIVIFVAKPGQSFSVQHIRNKLLPVTLLYLSLVPAIVLFAIFVMGSDFVEDGTGPYSRIISGVNSSKFLLGFITSVLVLSVSFFSASFLLWLKHWPNIYLGRD